MILAPAGGSRRRRARRRRLAYGLILYGGVGLALALASLVTLVGPIASLESLAGRRADAIRWLDLAATGLSDAQQSSSGAATSLVSAEASTRSAASLFGELAGTMAGLRDASRISILGTQPLASMTDDFDRVAGRSATLADEMTTLAGSLATEKTSLDQVAEDARRLRAEVADVRDQVARMPGAGEAGGVGTLLALLVGWLALPAVASLAIGIDQLRRLSRPHRRSNTETAGAF
jgi:hypothetical protein